MENSSNTPKPAPPKTTRYKKNPNTIRITAPGKPQKKENKVDRSPHLTDRPFLNSPEMRELQRKMNRPELGSAQSDEIKKVLKGQK